MALDLPKLPFELDALQPLMSKETLEYHYGKHHQGYITKLNLLLGGTQLEGLSLEDVVLQSHGKIFNNAAQAWNHNFFWHCLTPKGKGKPNGKLGTSIDKYFGTFETFKRDFTEAGLDFFGSGWIWLVEKGDGVLSIEPLADAGNPMTKDWKPLLVCDLWEHSYYIDFRNDRSRFLKAFWEFVDWDFVGKQIHG